MAAEYVTITIITLISVSPASSTAPFSYFLGVREIAQRAEVRA